MKSVFLKRAAIVVIAAVTMCVLANAQSPTFVKGDNVAGLGIGFGGYLYTGSGYTSKMPAISVYYENCIIDNLWDEKSSLGVGGMLGYTSAKWEHNDYGWKYTNIIFGARGTLHYAFVDKLDTYTGIMLGYNIVSDKEIGNHPRESLGSPDKSTPTWNWFLGARYYFTDNFANDKCGNNNK
jgi:hypothetical protein